MDEVNIRFFQAAATAIPTLLIAVVIGFRYIESTSARVGKNGAVAAALLLFVAALSGETAALRALVDGEGTLDQAFVSGASIVTIIMILFLVGMRPLFDQLPKWVAMAIVLFAGAAAYASVSVIIGHSVVQF